MNTTIKFSPSINILRDRDYKFNYIVTPNSSNIFNQIFTDALSGVKAHSIIGAYGTGKSSFLLAAQQTIKESQKHFKGCEKLIKALPKYEFINIVGDYGSFSKTVAEIFEVENKNYTQADIIKQVNKIYISLKKKGKGLAIVVDEFGKFLEFAVKNKPESELYFIQQLAELVNDAKTDMLFITTLHQDFNSYALSLNQTQQQEWDKVRGRLKDVVFNEPVEQLLFLASERISQKNKALKPNKDFDRLFNVIKASKAFPLKDYLQKEIAQKLLPFDILSSAVLTLALQKYGQNERSLFSFLESDNYLLESSGNKYYSLPQVYDYLIDNFYSSVNSTKYNSFYSQWGAIKKSVEKVEGVLPENSLGDAQKLIKTIGLLNIFSLASGKLDIGFYTAYSKIALGITDPEKIIKELEKFKIIRYTAYNFRFILQEGTDLDIDLAIDDAGRLVEKVTNVVAPLNLYFDFPFIAAKSVFYRKGTPRFFQFVLSEDPINQVPEDEIDGFINLVFSDDARALDRVRVCSQNCDEAILYGYYKNTAEIKNVLFEIQKVKKVIENNPTDKIALKYLNEIKSHHIKLLNYYVLDGLYADTGKVTWIYSGNNQRITSRHSLNALLSSIIEAVYHSTPTFKNELTNKTAISGTISSARRRLLNKLFHDLNKEELGFEANKFPPEKSIYLSLMAATGMHSYESGLLNAPTYDSFKPLWEAGIEFLESSKNKERSLQDLVYVFSTKPFKLKQGFISFWLPMFLLATADEYALYDSEKYIPVIGEDDIELILRRPGMFRVKAFDVKGVKLELFNRYRILLNQSEHQKPNNKIFIQTIKPFLSFYKELPEYAKKTQNLSKKALALRQVIATAKDPERTFFEEFPIALGFSIQELQDNPKLAEKYIKQMQLTIKELRTCFEFLLIRVENYIKNEVLGTKSDFVAYKNELKNRFKNVKTHLLLQHQKTFLNAIKSELDDKKSWLSSLAQSCVRKSLENFTDHEEELLYEKLSAWTYELDNLSTISEKDINEEEEELIQFEMTSFVQGLNKQILRIPKAKSKELEAKSSEIIAILGKDKKLNVSILAKLLREQLINE